MSASPGRIVKVIRWCGIGLLVLIGAAATKDLLHFARVSAKRETYCFSGYFTAAKLVLSGEVTGSLQNWDWFRAQTRRYGFHATDIFAGNPPPAALLMTPVAPLQNRQARVVWIYASLLFWAAGFVMLGWALFRSQGSPPALMIVAPGLLCLATLFEPFRENLAVAHVGAPLFLLQSLACALWLFDRRSTAGALAGASIAFKGYGLPLVLLAVFRRDWRFTAGAAIGFTALATVAGALTGFSQWTDFAGEFNSAVLTGMGTPALQTLKSFLVVALHPPTVVSGPLRVMSTTANAIMAVPLAMVMIAVPLWLAEFRRSASGPPSYAAVSACVLLNIVLSPRAEDYTYTLAMTALLLLLPELRKLDLAAAGIILGGFLLSWPFHFKDRTVITAFNLFTDFPRLWGGLILLAAALAAEWNRRRGLESVRQEWAGAWVACAVGILLTLWYAKPFIDPVTSEPVLAVSRSDNAVSLLRLDLDEREIATIPVTCRGPSGVAFTPRREWMYAACMDDSRISLIDLRQRRESKSFASSKYPDSAQQRPDSGEMWISNKAANTVAIYRSDKSDLLGELATGAGPSDIVFTNHGARAWVSNEASGTVAFYDADNRVKIGEVGVGASPKGMALTRNGDRLLVANFGSNTLSVIDTKAARELLQIPVCSGPVEVATSRHGRSELAFVSCLGAGAVGVVDIEAHQEIQRVPVGEKPLGIAVHPNGSKIYVCLSGGGQVVVLDAGQPSRILRRITMEANPLQASVAGR